MSARARSLALAALFGLIVLLAAARAKAAGNEIVLILDNSGSMATEWTFSLNGLTKRMKASDPERAAVLGALVLEGLVRGSSDRLTVIGFGSHEHAPAIARRSADEIRSIVYESGTFYRKPLVQARRILDGASPADGRILLFFTDGAPSDTDLRPEELPRLINLTGDARLSTFVLGLFGSDATDRFDVASRDLAKGFLLPLTRTPGDLEFLSKAREVVPALTRGYARALGARPDTGRLRPGETKSIPVGKYVIEVLVVTAGSNPSPDYGATLAGPAGLVRSVNGDNACPPNTCAVAARRYQTFRAPNDPARPSQWKLALPAGAPTDVEFGIILRYDLTAALVVPPRVSAGEAVPLEAELLFQGKRFDDEAFFSADGFEASASVEGVDIPLRHAGGGRFIGSWTPAASNKGSTTALRATFRNTWLERSADRRTAVEGILDLVLRPSPAPLELGRWRGERRETKRCGVIDLGASTNADRIEVTCTPTAHAGLGLACLPVPGSEAKLPGGNGQPLQWEVCATAPPCCVDLDKRDGLAVVFAGKAPHYASGAQTVPVRLSVNATGWLRCWWPYLAALGGVIFTTWLIAGWVRPHSFDPSWSVRVAGSEAGLRRTSALVLRELPGGVRGFYRSARVSLNASGDFIRSPRLAQVVLEAGPRGLSRFRRASGLERKNRKTGKWEPIPAADLAHGFAPSVIYRTGTLHLKFE